MAFDKTKYQKEYMRQKRAENPDYGAPKRIIKDVKGSILQDGERLAWVDTFLIDELADGSWNGWATLTWRFMTPQLVAQLERIKGVELEIELEKDEKTYTGKVIAGDLMFQYSRRPRIYFTGLGQLVLE